ncbi:MAG: galactose mutarotase [Pedobacter sp.]|nr:MAG: galactose mutarotase [Pedobacter sp.]
MAKASKSYSSALLLLLVLLFSTTQSNAQHKSLFGDIDGKPIYEYTLRNSNGMLVKVINYGASISDIITPDKYGKMGSVAFGFDSLKSYTGPQNALMGATVGRVANRIADGKFSLDGKEYVLTANIHGGKKGFDRRIWEVEEVPGKKNTAIRFSYFSKDGEEGFPGNLKVSVTYTLTNNNELKIDYKAVTDKATHVNLTNHTYFNLSGGTAENVLNTQLSILADEYLEAGKGNIPTGVIVKTAATPFDFSTVKAIGSRINGEDKDATISNGYDLTYVLRNQSGKLALAAKAYEPVSGRTMFVYTTEPGLVFYTGNHLNPGVIGRGKKPSVKYAAFCLETQHYPDAANQSTFPTTVLKPGNTYKSQTIYKFTVNH